MSIWPTPCSFKLLKGPPTDYHLFLQGILESSYFSTLLIHSTYLERLRLWTRQNPLSHKCQFTEGLSRNEVANIVKIKHWLSITSLKQLLKILWFQISSILSKFSLLFQYYLGEGEEEVTFCVFQYFKFHKIDIVSCFQNIHT